MSTVNEPKSREEIQREFDRLLKKHQARASQIATKAEQAERDKHRELVDRASGYTVESIVNGLAKLQLGFGSAVDDIADQLDNESSKLGEMRNAIEVEQARLEQLQGTVVAAEALAILEKGQAQEMAAFEEEAQEQRQALTDEMSSVRESWKEQAEQLEQDKAAAAEQQARTRALAEEAHNYEMERRRRLASDERATKRLELERQLAEEEAVKAKDWTAREKALAEEAEKLEELRTKAASYDEEVDAAAKAAREKAIASVKREAKFELEMLDKDHAGNVKVFELKVQTLEERIARQAELIAELDGKLDATIAKSQNLAEQAFRPTA